MNNIIFIDTETTGTDISNDRIIQFGYYDLEGRHGEILINPTIPIPESASSVHGIKDEHVIFQPTFKEVAHQILEIIKGKDIAGFNSNRFDIPLLFNEFERAGIEWDYKQHKLIDVGNLYKILNPRTLSAAYKQYTGREHVEAHGAKADAAATYMILTEMVLRSEVNVDDVSALELISNFDKPILDLSGNFKIDCDGDVCFAFGKHINKKAKTELGYLNWMLSASFLSDTKKICREIIENAKAEV